MLPGAVSVGQHVIGRESTPAAHPAMEVSLDSGLLTGAGAEVRWTGVGNMLTRIQPFVDDKPTPIVQRSGRARRTIRNRTRAKSQFTRLARAFPIQPSSNVQR